MHAWMVRGCVARDGNGRGAGVPAGGINVQLDTSNVPLGTADVLLWNMLALFFNLEVTVCSQLGGGPVSQHGSSTRR